MSNIFFNEVFIIFNKCILTADAEGKPSFVVEQSIY